MLKIFCFSIAVIFSVTAFCFTSDTTRNSKIYHINYTLTGVVNVVGTLGDLLAIPRIKDKTAMTDQELAYMNSQQQRDLIDKIDRWGLKQKASEQTMYRKISDYSMTPLILLPAFLAFNKNIRKDWFDLILMYYEGHVITFTFYNYSFLGPTFQNRYRPAAYYSEFSDADRKNGNNRNSFYSGHVATIAYSTFFMTKIYCDYHPEIGPSKYLWYLAAAVPPTLIGVARVKALAHFPSDCAVGLALGAAIGIIVPELHKHKEKKNLTFSMADSPEFLGLSMCLKIPGHRNINPWKPISKETSSQQ